MKKKAKIIPFHIDLQWWGASKKTTIDSNTFRGCEHIESIVIPDSVITIENGAFRCCNALKEVILGTSVETIDKKAFLGLYKPSKYCYSKFCKKDQR